MGSIADLFVTIGLNTTDFLSNLSGAKGSWDDFGKSLKNSSGDMTDAGKSVTALSAPLLALGGAALAAQEDIEQAFNTIRVSTGNTGGALTGLETTFNSVFGSMPASAADVATAISKIHQATGETGPDLDALATSVLHLSTYTSTGLTQTIQGVTEDFKAWQVSTANQQSTLDFLFKVVQNSNVTLGDLTESLASMAGPLQVAGFGLDQAAALIAQLSLAGVPAQTAIRGINTELANAAKMGITDGHAALQGLIDQIKAAPNLMAAGAIAGEDFGKRAGNNLAVAIRAGRFDLDAFLTSVYSSHDTLAKAAADTDTLGKELTIFKNNVELALQPLGQLIDEKLKGFVEQGGPAIEIVKGFVAGFTALPPFVQNVALSFGGVLAVIGPMAVGLGLVIGQISNLIPVITSAAGALGVTSLGLVAMTAAIAGLVVGTAIAIAAVKSNQADADKLVGDITSKLQLLKGVQVDTTAATEAYNKAIAGGGGIKDAMVAYNAALDKLVGAHEGVVTAQHNAQMATLGLTAVQQAQVGSLVAQGKAFNDAVALVIANTKATEDHTSASSLSAEAMKKLQTEIKNLQATLEIEGVSLDRGSLSLQDYLKALEDTKGGLVALEAQAQQQQRIYDNAFAQYQAGKITLTALGEALLTAQNAWQKFTDAAQKASDATAPAAEAFRQLGVETVAQLQEKLDKANASLTAIAATTDTNSIPAMANLGTATLAVQKIQDALNASMLAGLKAGDDLGGAYKTLGLESIKALTDKVVDAEGAVTAIAALFFNHKATIQDVNNAEQKLTEAQNNLTDAMKRGRDDGLGPLNDAFKLAGIPTIQSYKDAVDKAQAAVEAAAMVMKNGGVDAAKNYGTAVGALTQAHKDLKDQVDKADAALQPLKGDFDTLGVVTLATLKQKCDDADAALGRIVQAMKDGKAPTGDYGAAVTAAQVAHNNLKTAMEQNQAACSPYATALDALRVDSIEAMTAKVDDAKKAFGEVQAVWEASSKKDGDLDNLALAYAAAKKAQDDLTAAVYDAQSKLPGYFGIIGTAQKGIYDALGQVPGVMADAIVKCKNLGDAFVTLGQTVATEVLTKIIDNYLKAFVNSLSGILDQCGFIGKAIEAWAAPLNSAATQAAKVGTSLPSVPGVTAPPATTMPSTPAPGGTAGAVGGGSSGAGAGAGAGDAGGDAGGLGGSLGTAISAVTGIITAVSSVASAVIEGLTAFHENTLLGRIEESTRYVKIAMMDAAAGGSSYNLMQMVSNLMWSSDYTNKNTYACQVALGDVNFNLKGFWADVKSGNESLLAAVSAIVIPAPIVNVTVSTNDPTAKVNTELQMQGAS